MQVSISLQLQLYTNNIQQHEKQKIKIKMNVKISFEVLFKVNLFILQYHLPQIFQFLLLSI